MGKTHVNVRLRRLSIGCFGPKPTSNSIRNVQKLELLSNYVDGFSSDDSPRSVKNNQICSSSSKIMVVVDFSLEAKGALEWTLSRAVQNQDTIVLLHVLKSSKQGPESGSVQFHLKASELLLSMKKTCQIRKPGVEVEIALIEGKEKGQTIVKEAEKQKVSLLVLGQRKGSTFWCLMNRWKARRRTDGGIVEYCIQNSSCMTIAVRRKSKRLGGYLITTKRHKNFWLLA